MRHRELDVLPGVRRLVLTTDHGLGHAVLDQRLPEFTAFNDAIVPIDATRHDNERGNPLTVAFGCHDGR